MDRWSTRYNVCQNCVNIPTTLFYLAPHNDTVKCTSGAPRLFQGDWMAAQGPPTFLIEILGKVVPFCLFFGFVFEKRKRRYPAPTTHVRGCLVRMELCYYGPDFVSLFVRFSMQNCRYSRLINWVAHDWPSWSSWFEVLFCNEWLDISIVRPNDRIVWPSVECQLTSPPSDRSFFLSFGFSLCPFFHLWTTRLVVGFLDCLISCKFWVCGYYRLTGLERCCFKIKSWWRRCTRKRPGSGKKKLRRRRIYRQ